jgi:hypothetical protein
VYQLKHDAHLEYNCDKALLYAHNTLMKLVCNRSWLGLFVRTALVPATIFSLLAKCCPSSRDLGYWSGTCGAAWLACLGVLFLINLIIVIASPWCDPPVASRVRCFLFQSLQVIGALFILAFAARALLWRIVDTF